MRERVTTRAWDFCAIPLVLFIALPAPARAELSCNPPQQAMLDVELLLGRRGSDLKWRQFLAREVTPRFPNGLTVYETTGQWRDEKGVVTREKSRVLRVIVSADAQVMDKVGAVAEAYKTQFAQKSVGIVTREACVSF